VRCGAAPPDPRTETITLGELVDGAGRAGFGAVLLALALPAALPVPMTGMPAGIGVLITAGRLLLGYEHPWLPGPLRRVRLQRSAVRAGLRRLARLLRRAGRRPPRRGGRAAQSIGGPLGRWLTGVSVTLAGLVILVPIPFGNQLPGLAVAALGLGLLRRDAAALLAGHVLTLLALAWATAVLLAGHRLATWAAMPFGN
jgi:hypothetical protein